MYSIVIDDYTKMRQSTTYPMAHYSKCLGFMEELSEKYIFLLEGAKYFEKPLYRKRSEITKGHALVREDYGFYCKITVYRREPRGYIYSGDLKKIVEFTTVRMQDAVHPKPREEEMYDLWYETFKSVIRMIDETVEKIDSD